MTSEHAELELVHALADGELAGTEADRVRAHLATCAECQAELADVRQLATRTAGKGDVLSLAWYRRRQRRRDRRSRRTRARRRSPA